MVVLFFRACRKVLFHAKMVPFPLNYFNNVNFLCLDWGIWGSFADRPSVSRVAGHGRVRPGKTGGEIKGDEDVGEDERGKAGGGSILRSSRLFVWCKARA